jgi:hypothetical protein
MSDSKPQDNPYLSHLPPSQRGVAPQGQPIQKEPLFGWIPRMVKGKNVRQALVCLIAILRVMYNQLYYRMVMSIRSQNNRTLGSIRRF